MTLPLASGQYLTSQNNKCIYATFPASASSALEVLRNRAL